MGESDTRRNARNGRNKRDNGSAKLHRFLVADGKLWESIADTEDTDEGTPLRQAVEEETMHKKNQKWGT